jgi:hypothetical protein
VGMNSLRPFILLVLIGLIISASPVLFGQDQPQGYTLVCSLPRSYYVDWMDIKAVYVKDEGDRLHFYIEYYGVMPSSVSYARHMRLIASLRGDKYAFNFILYGNNFSSVNAWVGKFVEGELRWTSIENIKSGLRQAHGLSSMEILLDKRDIGYILNEVATFHLYAYGEYRGHIEQKWNYVIGSLIKQITIDGDPSDWSSVAPLVTFPPGFIGSFQFGIMSLYVANDDEYLYFRIDASRKPLAVLNRSDSQIYRIFDVYIDTDNNDVTGDIKHGGAEFYVHVVFEVNAYTETKYSKIVYSRYVGGEKWEYLEESKESSDFNEVFEFKVPLKLLRLSSGQIIGIEISFSDLLFHYDFCRLDYQFTYIAMEVYQLIIATIFVIVSFTVYRRVKKRGATKVATLLLGEKASVAVSTSPSFEAELKKYEEYLRKLEELRAGGKVSEQVYQALKKEYEAKVEELRRAFRRPGAS